MSFERHTVAISIFDVVIINLVQYEFHLFILLIQETALDSDAYAHGLYSVKMHPLIYVNTIRRGYVNAKEWTVNDLKV